MSIAVTYALLIIGALTIVLPLYMTAIIPFKTVAENTASYFALPSRFNLDNFRTVLAGGRFLRALANTANITAFVLLGKAILMPMLISHCTFYASKARFYRFVYYFILISIFIPFQVKMMPLVKLLSSLRMMHPTGLSPLTLPVPLVNQFSCMWAMQSLPEELEAAAYIDGATHSRCTPGLLYPW